MLGLVTCVLAVGEPMLGRSPMDVLGKIKLDELSQRVHVGQSKSDIAQTQVHDIVIGRRG